ncbi:hypothetical protein PR202_ga30934 [Eleusine coracana subsp. coracana]|uniref:Pectinesterase inhibitor domain-containing protein n=1 Tax=Eleusine coracana subsp. coracana TaxID=191504 RepID=A0AAV5DPP4_ELECO|nr:hypothetical protein PR202_ga30934 [Eleusine coracana subsp. coracana]
MGRHQTSRRRSCSALLNGSHQEHSGCAPCRHGNPPSEHPELPRRPVDAPRPHNPRPRPQQALATTGNHHHPATTTIIGPSTPSAVLLAGAGPVHLHLDELLRRVRVGAGRRPVERDGGRARPLLHRRLRRGDERLRRRRATAAALANSTAATAPALADGTVTQALLRTCAAKYGQARDALGAARDAIADQDYDYAQVHVSAAAEYPQVCKALFRRQRPGAYPAELAAREDALAKLCAVSLDIIALLSNNNN